MDELIFLGTSDSMGVPRIYCDCGVCTEARRSGINRRYRSSVLLRSDEGDLLVDCGPDWALQMERLGKREITQSLITHAHFDHIAGLPEWMDACRWTGKRGEVYAPTDVIATIRMQFPWLENHLTYHAIEQKGISFGGWSIEPHLMCHGKNGTSYAYRFMKNGIRWAYCPDAINLNEDQQAFLAQLDGLIIGTNFYKEEAEMSTRSVYDMVEALELIQKLKPKHVWFTHMGHGVDLNADYPLPSNVTLGRAGMTIDLSSLSIQQ